MYKWELRFLEVAELVSTWSKDKSTKVGCVITTPDRRILATGYNGLPRNADDNTHLYPKRHDRNEHKYDWYEHAERNAIYNAAYLGVPLKGAAAYVTMKPCADCARGIAQSGITQVFWDETKTALYYKSRGLIDLSQTEEILLASGVISFGLRTHPRDSDQSSEEQSAE